MKGPILQTTFITMYDDRSRRPKIKDLLLAIAGAKVHATIPSVQDKRGENLIVPT